VCVCVCVCVLQAYYHIIRTYEAKLDEYGIPVAELGFEPPAI
jgi:hypothetical protein